MKEIKLMLFGLLLMICRESDTFSSDLKTILLGISAVFIAIAFKLMSNNIDQNEARIINLEEEIAKLKRNSKKQ